MYSLTTSFAFLCLPPSNLWPYFLKVHYIYPQTTIIENSNFMIFLLPLEMTCKPTAHTTPLFPNYHCFLLLIALGFFVCFVLWLWSLKTQRAGLLLTNLSVDVAAPSGRQSHSIAVHSPIFHLVLRSYYPRKWKAIAIYPWKKNSLFSICPQLFHH